MLHAISLPTYSLVTRPWRHYFEAGDCDWVFIIFVVSGGLPGHKCVSWGWWLVEFLWDWLDDLVFEDVDWRSVYCLASGGCGRLYVEWILPGSLWPFGCCRVKYDVIRGVVGYMLSGYCRGRLWPFGCCRVKYDVIFTCRCWSLSRSALARLTCIA
jgi:hypothetical protein